MIERLGEFYMKINDIPNMIKYLKLGMDYGDTISILNLIDHYSKQNDKDEVEKNMQIGRMKRDPTIVLRYFEWLLKNDNDKGFIDNVNLAIELGEFSAYSLLGVYYKRKKDYDNAKKYFMEGIKKGNVQCMFNMAVLYQNDQKDTSLMEKYYKMAMDNGKLVPASNNLAIYYLDAKQIDKAIETLEPIMNNERDMGFANVTMGTCYELKKDYPKMLKYWIRSFQYGCNIMKIKVTKYLISNTDKYFDIIIDNYKWIPPEVMKNVNINLLSNSGSLEEYRKVDCQLCEKKMTRAIIPCDHPICMKCYVDSDECRICKLSL